MRSAAVTLLAAATAASAQTSISFFYPSEMPSNEDFENIALSIVEVPDADHTVVAFSCLSSTTSASWPSSTSSSFDDEDDDSDSYYYDDACVFVGGALTATVGPDSFAYTTVVSYNSYDLTVKMGCTSADEVGLCTYQSEGADAWSDYCSYSTDIVSPLSRLVTHHLPPPLVVFFLSPSLFFPQNLSLTSSSPFIRTTTTTTPSPAASAPTPPARSRRRRRRCSRRR